MLKIRSIYYLLPIRRTMDPLKKSHMRKMKRERRIPEALERIADALERLLKYTEMKL